MFMAPPSMQMQSTTGDSEAKEENPDINWDELGFGLTTTDYMYVAKCSIGEQFLPGSLVPYGDIEVCPSSSVLNYGQGVIEGLKAYRREDGGIMLFRPQENARRMQMGAQRMLMAVPSTHQFLDAVKRTVLANKRWVPPHGKGSLYLRPLLIGSGAILGMGPAPEFTLLVYASPIGLYCKEGKSMNLVIQSKVHRASPGGTGDIKSITNYSPGFEVIKQAKDNGFDDVLFLDAATGKYIEEASSCNIFILKGDVISTPVTQGTILPGITRKSIMEIAQDFGYKVEERLVPVEDVLAADEVFCTGTAVVVTPVGSITYQENRIEYRTGKDAVSQNLFATLTGIQTGLVEDKKGWTIQID